MVAPEGRGALPQGDTGTQPDRGQMNSFKPNLAKPGCIGIQRGHYPAG